MERMKQDIKYVSIGMYKQLEEENKNLRAYADNLDSENDNQAIEIEELKKENKKLKERIKELEQCNLNLQTWLDNKEKVNKSLREENEKLKKYYDRDKEELMESCYSLAKENDKLKSDLMEDMKEITKLEEENKKLKECNKSQSEVINNVFIPQKERLEEENKKLKSDLSECECSFGFESDEIGFWEREYKRLKKWIKDHCKGYGNLFPEDEMKRQRKKADKKRK